MWEVFYTPHTDDESIGMAGAITRARARGHSVLVVLVTDNEPSTRGRRVFPLCLDLETQRKAEWVAALRALDVTEYECWDIPERQIRHDPFAAQTEMISRMRDVHTRLQPTHHHTVWGSIDVHPLSGYTSISHVLCANALAILAAEDRSVRVSLYGIYVYASPSDERLAPTVHTLTSDEHARKQDALNCYKAEHGAIGYGYASVPELIDAAHADSREYLIEVSYGTASGAAEFSQ